MKTRVTKAAYRFSLSRYFYLGNSPISPFVSRDAHVESSLMKTFQFHPFCLEIFLTSSLNILNNTSPRFSNLDGIIQTVVARSVVISSVGLTYTHLHRPGLFRTRAIHNTTSPSASQGTVNLCLMISNWPIGEDAESPVSTSSEWVNHCHVAWLCVTVH